MNNLFGDLRPTILKCSHHAIKIRTDYRCRQSMLDDGARPNIGSPTATFMPNVTLLLSDMATTRKSGDQSVDSSNYSIVIEDLVKTFGGGRVVAVDEINLNIGQDEFVVLVGPSGCGKTTTLRCICGLEDPDSGQITLNGQDVTHHTPRERDLAFVFQDIALFPHMTVRDNMRFGLDMATKLSGEEKEQRVRSAAEMLGIDELLDRKPSALSGGQQQRVSIGRAMVTEPAAFLLDEPFSALDANLRDRMRTEVKQLQRELETAMVFVTHDQEEAMTLGDKIVVMNEGGIMQVGSPYEIYNEPENRFVAEFIGSPSTNLFQCQVENRGEEVNLVSDIFTMSFDGVESLSEGDVVQLGIRPEHLKLQSDDRDGLFGAEIDVIEPHGTNDAIYLSTENGTEVTAVTSQNEISSDESPVSVEFETERVWLFDENGERIR